MDFLKSPLSIGPLFFLCPHLHARSQGRQFHSYINQISLTGVYQFLLTGKQSEMGGQTVVSVLGCRSFLFLTFLLVLLYHLHLHFQFVQSLVIVSQALVHKTHRQVLDFEAVVVP